MMTMEARFRKQLYENKFSYSLVFVYMMVTLPFLIKM